MRGSRWSLPLLLALAWVGCRTTAPGRVIQFTPGRDEVSDSDLARGLRVTFDRPVGPDRAGPAGAAFVISPPLDGEARWLDRKTLAFFPRGKPQESTAYRVSLDPRLVTAPQARLVPWAGARFVFRRIAITSTTLSQGSVRFQGPVPVLTLRATRPIRPADAVSACAFLEQRPDRRGPAIAARENDGQIDTAPTVRLRPSARLRPGTEYVLRCETSLRPAAGGEGLARPHEFYFGTAGAAGIRAMLPEGNDVTADGVTVQVAFTSPMDPRRVRERVRLVQDGGGAVPIALAADASDITFSWTGDLEPNSRYQLVVDGGLVDLFGQAVTARTHEFEIGDASPRLRMERGIFVVERASGRYPIWTRNLSAFQVKCAAIPEASLAPVLTGPANYDAWWDASGGPPDYPALGLDARESTVQVKGTRNQWVDQSLALQPTCGGGASGVYLVEAMAEADRRGSQRRSLVNVTDLGLLAKVGNASSLIWVVRLSSGQPVANAAVKVRDLAGKVRFAGRTGADGVVLAPGATQLVGVKPQGQAPQAEEGEEWEPGSHRVRRVLVTAQLGDDLAVLDTNWNNGIQIWNYQLPEDRGGGVARVRGFIHSDRGLYRPGDTVHLRGLVRRIEVDGRMAVPRQRKIQVTISDPRGGTMVHEELAVSAFGSFSRDLALPTEAALLGDYRVQAQLEGQQFSERFSVEEYRPRTFEVKVKTPKQNVFLGEPLTFSLAADYLFGAPLGGAKVSWQLRRRSRLPVFPGFEGYSFQDLATAWDEGRRWARDEERSFSDGVADGEVTLDEAGKGVITAEGATDGLDAPHDFLLQATVQDGTGQAVTATEVVGGHMANLYLGLHPSEWVQAVDMPFGVQVVAFDAQGKRRAAAARLTITRRTYDCRAGEYGVCQRATADKPSIDRKVAVPAAGSAAVQRVNLRQPGEYLVQVTATDERGHQALANQTVYLVGPGEAFWSGDEGDRMTLIASKARYQPGDTARLVPQAQMRGARALVTLERDGVLSYQVQTLTASGQALEVPIEPRLAPNAFASVVLVRGRTGKGDAGRPRFKMGVVDLVVDSGASRLAVAVTTDRPSYRPGELVRAQVKLTGSDGAPVKGELALAVADEGVLQINGFKTPDPMPVFYASWGLGVESATTWNRQLLRRSPDELEDGDEGGDGGGDEAGRIRSRFMATAFWKPALVTDGDGVVEVSFRAPDNLTAFRVMAVAADAADRFGSGERRFTVNKPLLAAPALPRFLVAGDQLRAVVMVHNNSEQALSVQVRATAQGVTLTGTNPQTVQVPAGQRRPVGFPGRVGGAGSGIVTFHVAGGKHRDAVETRLPISSGGAPELLVVGEGLARGRVEHPLPQLGSVVPGSAALEVSLDPTGLARLEEGLKYLVGYPYGCLEQTTSQMVPMIALGDLTKALDLKDTGAAEARRFVEVGVAKVLRHQHPDGGFGLWPGTPPEVHYTAYGLWGLHLARRAGFTVDPHAFDRGAGYLQQRMSERPGDSAAALAGEGGARAFAGYVLDTAGRGDPGALVRLHQDRQQLPLYGRAFLARALRSSRPELAAALADELAAGVTGKRPLLLREEQAGLDYYWSSDIRTTALVLSALLEIRPGHPAVAQLSEGLLEARQDGRWPSTQDNVYALLALADLARVRSASAVTATLALGGQVVSRHVLTGRVGRVRLPLAGVRGPLVVDGDGPLFYAARVHLVRPMDAAQPQDRGLTVERAYLDPETGAPLDSLKVGQLARVRVQVHAQKRLAHVAVVDRLPAGVEPVLTRFQPTLGGDGDQSSSPWAQSGTLWQYQALRDDRAELFADVLEAGTSEREYLVRAVAAGTFAAPAATAEAMYRPAVRGSSSAATLVVVP